MAKVKTPRWGWALTGSGHFFKECLGMIAALDLNRAGYHDTAGWRVYREALRLGAYLRPLGSTVYVAPPLNIPDPDLDQLLDIVEASVGGVLASPG